MPDASPSTLDLDEPKKLRAVARELLAERIGWLSIAAIVLAGLIGFLGPGPLSYREQSSENGELSVEYSAVERYESPAKLTVRFADIPRPDRMIRLALSRDFADEIVPEATSPPPDSTTMLATKVVHAFRVADLGEEGHVIFRYKNNRWGWRRIQISLVDGPTLEIEQFICP
jgi:hypothetical protein